jgi:colicin import membrane protein
MNAIAASTGAPTLGGFSAGGGPPTGGGPPAGLPPGARPRGATRERHNSVPAFLAALTMHAGLIGWMWFAVQWHTSDSAPAVAELIDLGSEVTPAPPPPAPVVEAPPQPAPPPPPPPPSEAPSPPKPDIALKQEAPRKTEEAPPREAQPKKQAKPTPPKPTAQELRRQQAQAEKQHEEEMRRLASQAGTPSPESAPSARSNGPVSNEWIARVRGAVRSHLSYAVPDGISPDVYASFKVELLPTGEQATEPVLVKSSGLPAFDEAARRAIIRTDPFPRKEDGTVPPSFILELHPQDVR